GSVMLRVTGVFPGRSVAAVLDISAGAAWKVVPSALSVMANSAGPVLTPNTAVAPLESVEYGAMFGFGFRVTDGFDSLAYTTPLTSFMSSRPPPPGSGAVSEVRVFRVLLEVSMTVMSGSASSLLLTQT